ncbi:MAG: hypothetical protein R6X09_01695 [Bacteroidales bacterium]
MKRIIIPLAILTAAILLKGCEKDPLTDVESGDWNHERNILGIRFDGQIGKASILRNENEARIEFKYYSSTSPDASAVEILEMEISYGASSSVTKGQSLNFENPDKKATVTITPVNGEPLEWTITLIPFSESLLGTWDIDKLVVFGGTGPDYGGAAVLNMTDKPWCWSATNGPAAEEDNTLTFALEGVTPEGNPYGSFSNNAGNDALFADFMFTSGDSVINLNGFYRKIPDGTGKWMRNYAEGTVIFQFPDNTVTTATLRLAGTYDLGWDKSKTVANHSFEFELSGIDDWDHIYSDYDKFVKRPRKFWIDMSRSK